MIPALTEFRIVSSTFDGKILDRTFDIRSTKKKACAIVGALKTCPKK
jgi:hypothetical protein